VSDTPSPHTSDTTHAHKLKSHTHFHSRAGTTLSETPTNKLLMTHQHTACPKTKLVRCDVLVCGRAMVLVLFLGVRHDGALEAVFLLYRRDLQIQLRAITLVLLSHANSRPYNKKTAANAPSHRTPKTIQNLYHAIYVRRARTTLSETPTKKPLKPPPLFFSLCRKQLIILFTLSITIKRTTPVPSNCEFEQNDHYSTKQLNCA